MCLRPLYSVNTSEQPSVTPPLFLDGQAMALPSGVNLDLGQALDLLRWLSLNSNFSVAWEGARVTAHMLCKLAVTKRGTISDQKLNSVLETLPPALARPIRAQIRLQTILDVYSILSSRLN